MIALALVIGGCDKGEGNGKPGAEEKSKSRVNAVKAAEPEKAPPPDAFCDRYVSEKKAETFEYPKLRGEPPEESDGWRWVNVWATWCKPCIEEMPRMVDWKKKLADEGLKSLVLISVDETREKVDAFRKKHPETPESLLIEKPQAIKPWVESLGLSKGAPLPVHVFVDPSDRVRCLRAGGIGKDEFRAVKRLIGS